MEYVCWPKKGSAGANQTHNSKLDGYRVGLLAQGLRKGIVQPANVLEPILVYRVPEHQVFGAICSVCSIGDFSRGARAPWSAFHATGDEP